VISAFSTLNLEIPNWGSTMNVLTRLNNPSHKSLK
jgi:hypothetical protein